MGLAWMPAIVGHAAHTQVRLLLADDQARPGNTILAGIDLQMEKGWHTYWRNPGDSGAATKVVWHLPKGVTPDSLQWPAPQKLSEKITGEDFTTYIYTNEALLLVPLKLATDLSPGSLELKADVSWLECQTECIPGQAEVSATLVIGAQAKPSASASLLQSWQKKLPASAESVSPQAWWAKAASGDTRPIIIEWTSARGAGQPDFFPDAYEKFEVHGATQQATASAGKVAVGKQLKKLSGDWPIEVSGLLVEQMGTQRVAYEARVPIQPKAPPGAASEAMLESPQPLWKMLCYAFIGGLILNAMPCVLPVIALKILGFVKQSGEHPGRVRMLGLVYTSGVLISFLALALLVVGLQAAGQSVGQGFQFKSPYFLATMTCLATLIALNLFGVFEVSAGGRAIGAAAQLSSRHGAAGAFFNGLLTTVLASSCTAPFQAAAIGFALAQPPVIIALIMLTVGLGMAAPYLFLSWNPQWLKFLPKPGGWMEKFKIVMGFPMLGAAVWLYSQLADHYGDRAWWMALFLVILGLAAWLYGEFVQRGTRLRWLGGVVALLVLGTGYWFAIEKGMLAPPGIAWQDWSTGAVAQARAQGRPVLVDFTAKWCLTCNTVVKPALESDAVRKKIAEVGVVPLLANYTLQPPEITAELRRFGRAGVPLVLVYPRDPNAAPMVFDLPTRGTILAALDKAGK